jgi:uncharacterized protein (TIGR02145 family)
MERKFRICTVLLISFWIGGVLLLTGCKKDPVVPTLTTEAASDITTNTATTGGNITSNGGAEVTARGVCWALTTQPSLIGPHTSDSQGDGNFTSNLTGLTPGTTYYLRAFAVNKAGTAYGNEVSFATTELAVPVLTTAEATNVTSSSAVSGGNISSDGGASVTARGICWAVAANPTISDNKTSNGTGTGSFTSDLTGLQSGTIYHARAYATNSIGTAYGNDITFTTLAVRPTLTTASVSNITYTSAISGGNITNSGGATVNERGVCWGTSSGPVATGLHTSNGTGTGTFTSNITGLNPGTTYYLRAYATNSAGTSYGNELIFTANSASAPTLTTNAVTGVALTTAISGGNITSNNGSAVTESGVCWNTTGNPTTANSKTSDQAVTGTFTSNISGLTAGTVYYVRAYAVNSAGTGYGSVIRFSTSISDIEGNIYKTVLIGNQIWMAENLKVTKYNDNANIPNVTDNDAWILLSAGAYCWMLNDETTYKNMYGALYNWYATQDGKLCPTGWHVPSDGEFKTLELFLGVPSAEIDVWGWRGTDQGAQLKSTSGWLDSGNGTNSSGFTALAGGYRYAANGTFSAIGILTYLWSSTLDGTDAAWYRRLDGDNSKIYMASTSVKGGKYIRCVKN